MNIIRKTWKWAYPLSRRVGAPKFVNWHHAAAKRLSPGRLHKLHLSLGWAGFGYNLYIRKSGKIYRGRPLHFCGGGALGHWDDVGVCVEGNYEVEKEMPAKQLLACQQVHDWLDDRYAGLTHRKHKHVPGNQTACPGKHFPFAAILSGVPAESYLHLTEKSITVPRQYKPHRAGWWNTGLVPFIERVRKQGDGKRLQLVGDPIVIPVPAERPKWWAKMMRWKKRQREQIVVVPDAPAADPLPEPEHPIPTPTPTIRKRSPLFWRRKR